MTRTHLKLNFVAASDRGLVRGNNEDSAYAGPHLLVLADGMGGHAAGEVASQLMVEHMEHLDRAEDEIGDADLLALLGAAAEDANASISASIDENPEQDGMGTTLTALMFNGTDLGLIHVGDSRGYRLRDGELTQITVDDTFVQSLVQQGKLDPEDVSSHPQKSLILKAYTGRPVEPYLEQFEARAGDRYLLCSDGLSDPVTHSTIETALAAGTPAEAAQRLIELALRSGGPDNVTVVVADVVDGEDSDCPELPAKAAMAGALVTGEDPTHPDTAAGRAANLVRTSRTVESNATATKAGKPAGAKAAKKPAGGSSKAVGAAGSDAEADEEDHRRGSTLPAVITLLAVALIGLGGIWWFDSARSSNYFVATNDNGEFVINNGFNATMVGKDLFEPYQQVCINDDNKIRLESLDGADCQRFSVNDLPESARGQAEELDSGSYDEVTRQLNGLADEAMPVCVDKQENEDEGDKNDETGTPEAELEPVTECREVN